MGGLFLVLGGIGLVIIALLGILMVSTTPKGTLAHVAGLAAVIVALAGVVVLVWNLRGVFSPPVTAPPPTVLTPEDRFIEEVRERVPEADISDPIALRLGRDLVCNSPYFEEATILRQIHNEGYNAVEAGTIFRAARAHLC